MFIHIRAVFMLSDTLQNSRQPIPVLSPFIRHLKGGDVRAFSLPSDVNFLVQPTFGFEGESFRVYGAPIAS